MKRKIDPEMPEQLKKAINSLVIDPIDDMESKDFLIHYMNNSELWDEENNFTLLKEFIKDTIVEYRLEKPYHKKWHIVYHESTYRHTDFLIELYQQILDKLS